ncbi:MAG: exosortase/archaeosortase family protein, partial [Terrimicrobiaceae bacterium]
IVDSWSDDVGLFWYMPSGKQRHHTVRICMKYRGIELHPSSDDPAVMTDGELWMREFFLQDGRLLDTHLDYVKSTLGPGKSPGVHLIFVAEKDSLSATEFDKKSRELATRLYAMTLNPDPKAGVPPEK